MQIFQFADYTKIWKAIHFSKCWFSKNGMFCGNEKKSFVMDQIPDQDGKNCTQPLFCFYAHLFGALLVSVPLRVMVVLFLKQKGRKIMVNHQFLEIFTRRSMMVIVMVMVSSSSYCGPLGIIFHILQHTLRLGFYALVCSFVLYLNLHHVFYVCCLFIFSLSFIKQILPRSQGCIPLKNSY